MDIRFTWHKFSFTGWTVGPTKQEKERQPWLPFH